MTDQPKRDAIRAARVYLRVNTDEQDLTRQEAIVGSARAAGFYVAAVYREKASGARPDRPELLRMVADLQAGEVVIAEKIDRISRLPLAEAELLNPLTTGPHARFLALRDPRAAGWQQALKARNCITDLRGDVLRIGLGLYQDEADVEAFAILAAEL